MTKLLGASEELREVLTRRIEEDADAFDGVMDARGLPRNSDEEKSTRKTAINTANLHATRVPLQTMRDSLAVMQQSLVAAASGNPNSASDAGVAGLMAHAAAEGAWLNVKINLSGLDAKEAKSLEADGSKLLNQSRQLRDDLLKVVDEKIEG